MVITARSARGPLGRTLVVAVSAAATALAPACLPDERPVALHATCNADACVCELGFGNCDTDPSNGCETELRLDPEHCGRCGHSCFEGGCFGGQCTPYQLTPPLFDISGMDAGGEDVFLCDPQAGAIGRVSQSDGALSLLFADQNCSTDVAVGADRVFWRTIAQGEYRDFLWSATFAGGGLVLVGMDGWILDVEAFDDHVVWLGRGDDELGDRIMLAVVPGREPVIVYRVPADERVDATAVGPAGVYWSVSRWGALTASTRIWRAPETGAPELVAVIGGYGVDKIEVYGTDVYWVESDFVDDDVTQPAAYRVMRSAAAGQVPVELWADARSIRGLAVDASGAYWNAGGDIMALRTGRDTPEVIAKNQEVSDLESGDRLLVWHDSPGKLMALAK